jgi:diadenosine tetraphosphate (Ap4A) HIT family hydrolase
MSVDSVVLDCPFCLSNGQLKTRIIDQNNGAILIDSNKHPGIHLIIPIEHVERLEDLPDDWWASFKQLLPSVPGLDGHDYNVSINLGEIAGQTLKHLHFWIIPREANQPASNIGMAGLIKLVNEQ